MPVASAFAKARRKGFATIWLAEPKLAKELPFLREG